MTFLIYPKVVAVVGPTASGKTDLALRLAKRFHGFVISADSRQMYKGMNIGTAKPALSSARKRCRQKVFEISGVSHFMFDVLRINENYNVALFQKTVYEILTCMYRRDPTLLPFIVGGTGLYVDAVIEHWNFPGVLQHSELRKKLEKFSTRELFQRLKKLDPVSAQRIDPLNKRRLIRALEFVMSSGTSFVRAQKKNQPLFKTLLIGNLISRKQLYARIDKRVEAQLKTGLVNEARKLVTRYGWTPLLSQTIGYQELRDFFNSHRSLEESVLLIKRNVRHYAKRQITWWRKKPVHWVGKTSEAARLVKKFLAK